MSNHSAAMKMAAGVGAKSRQVVVTTELLSSLDSAEVDWISSMKLLQLWLLLMCVRLFIFRAQVTSRIS